MPWHVSLTPLFKDSCMLISIVAERLKQEGRQEIFQNETMEELEDEEGNVYNKKTYDDLKKQGLI